MEEVATSAANTVIGQGPMGAIAILLAAALLSLLIFHFKETARLHGLNDELQSQWRKDTAASVAAVHGALDTVRTTIAALSNRSGA